MSEVPGWGVKLATEVEALQEAFAAHVKDNKETHKDLYARTERPSWTVTWVLTIMGGLLGSLLMYALSHPPTL